MTASSSPPQASWTDATVLEPGDAMVAAMAAAGVEYLFFTSGSELAFYQEAIAKAEALGRPAPRLLLFTHEYVAINAALGYCAASGKPAALCVRGSRATSTNRAAIIAGQNRLPGRANPTPASAEYNDGLSPTRSTRISGPT